MTDETARMENTSRVEVGDAPAPREFGPVTTSMFVQYSGASGDLNPVHYDHGFATKAGYPSVFAQGMLLAALLSTFATDWLGPDQVRRFSVRFLDQLWPGDTLTCRGVVTHVAEGPEGRSATITLAGERPDGTVAISATAEFLLRE
ncbi:MAG: putative Fatty acid synthase subunit beta [Subtercola sp.]|nr:putative Fatty acid synthase subunit beta [Subtercola sp.]